MSLTTTAKWRVPSEPSLGSYAETMPPPLDDHAVSDSLLPLLVAVVGVERFAEARARQVVAPGGSTDREWFDVVWEIFDAICVPAVGIETRVGAVVALYDLAPSYTVLSQGLRMHQRYDDLPRDIRLWLWEQLRPYLDAEDERVAQPLVYALWEEFFDDPLEAEVWAAIVGARWPLEERLLTRILRRSGPVAPDFKYPLYERLLEAHPGRWDSDIYAGLMDTFNWYTLRLDEARAESILSRLSLPDKNAPTAYHNRLEQERTRRSR
jgi:hypothetical protein